MNVQYNIQSINTYYLGLMNSIYKKFLCVFSLVIITMSNVGAQDISENYFQQEVSYDITAKIDTNHIIEGATSISYTHNGIEDLDTFFIHLWMNSFKDRLSAFSEQSIRINALDFYFAKDGQLGGYEDLKVYLNDSKVELYSWKRNKDVVYFLLPKKVKRGETITIDCTYELELPKNFARTGYKKDDDYLMYWYPTPAVYDQNGWHPMPYLMMGEFYTEVADFKVQLETPHSAVIGSTLPQSNGNIHTFEAEDMIDFAIVTSEKKKIFSNGYKSKTGKTIDIQVLSDDKDRGEAAIVYVSNALEYIENKIGAFPYPSLSIIDKGKDGTSGMEYPGLITISGPDDDSGTYEYYIVHELLHQYFYGALAFNQRKYAWLDEGLTTYYQQRYYRDQFGKDYQSENLSLFMQNEGQPALQNAALGQACRHYHCSLHTSSDNISPINYLMNAYEVPARMYAYLESYLGDDFDIGMKDFYANWKYKHPQPRHLQSTLEAQSGKDLNWFFGELINVDWSYDYKAESLENGQLVVDHVSGSAPPYPVQLSNSDGATKTIWVDGHRGEKTVNVGPEWQSAIIDNDALSMDINRNNNFANVKRPIKIYPIPKLDDGRYRELFITPLASYNTSDGAQLGVAFYNSTFPSKKLKWALAPAYAFGSKTIVGEGWLSYDKYLTSNRFRKLQFKLNAKRYSFRAPLTLDALQYMKLDPTISLHLQHDAKDSKYSKIYFKPILINEEYFRFEEEDVFIENRNSTIYRLGYDHYNFWNLGPYDIKVQLEYQPYANVVGEKHAYTKLSAELNKSFKYSPSQSVDFRIWASYFLQNTQRESSSYDGEITRGSSALIYQGFNDYSYDDYFFNRENQDVRLDNQVSNGGGGFKTPLGSQYSLGQSNDLAFALNFKSDLPIKMPALFPLKLFLDVGYFTSKATQMNDLAGSTLYSGGVMLEYGDGLISFHLPLFNSAAISDIYETEGVSTFGRLSFKLDLQRFNPWDMAEDFRL